MVLAYHQSADLFLFCPLSRKENIFCLCLPCVSSEAGVEKHALTYPLSKAGTIGIADGLRGQLMMIVKVLKEGRSGD